MHLSSLPYIKENVASIVVTAIAWKVDAHTLITAASVFAVVFYNMARGFKVFQDMYFKYLDRKNSITDTDETTTEDE